MNKLQLAFHLGIEDNTCMSRTHTTTRFDALCDWLTLLFIHLDGGR